MNFLFDFDSGDIPIHKYTINYSEILVIIMALYMHYRAKVKSENVAELDEVRSKFKEIYKRHKVDIVGFWENAEDPSEVIYISRYEDEDDYKKTVEALNADESYLQLGKDLDKIRLEMQSTRMNPTWIPN